MASIMPTTVTTKIKRKISTNAKYSIESNGAEILSIKMICTADPMVKPPINRTASR